MCDNDESNWVWSLRDRKTGKPVTSSDGYTYFFAEEQEARALLDRMGSQHVELIQTREPGA